MQYYDEFPEYVPVVVRRSKTAKKLTQLRKKMPNIKPVVIEGRTLATTWWGKCWNRNLERYADYSNRIERGRSYVRHGSVLDLQLAPTKITALVQGSRSNPYKVVINVDKLKARNWSAIRKACEGNFDSLGELLAGKFPKALQELFFEEGAGLFPIPQEIHFDCSCPDWASMCKHIAATLYGVGARLDEDASLFFTLRGIDTDDLVTRTVADTAHALLSKAESRSSNVLDGIDLGEVFGIRLDDIEAPLPDLPSVKVKTPTSNQKTARPRKTVSRKRSSQVSRRIEKKPVLQNDTMLATLLKAVGKARKGNSVDQLREKLGWTKSQVRYAIHRARTKDLVETVNFGVYRQKV